MNVFQKMAAITAELQTVAKNLQVKAGAGTYKAVSERDIIDAVKPLEEKHGVFSFPVSREIVESERLESESEYNGKVTKKTTFYLRIKTVYRFVNTEKPDEFIEMTTYADGLDTGDKGCGKAMTYADKYALMKAYKISTGDDPDQEASQERRYTAAQAKVCADCGAEIKAHSGASAAKVAAATEKAYGRALCYDCGIKEKERREGINNAE